MTFSPMGENVLYRNRGEGGSAEVGDGGGGGESGGGGSEE